MPAGAGKDDRQALVRLLQAAHAGELAAARAYRGHWHTLRRPAEREGVRRIEAAEWHHRRLVHDVLVELGARPQSWREHLMGNVGRLFGFLCRFAGWFFPMYVAGLLEAMNVAQYETAAAHARAAGLDGVVPRLDEMVVEEQRHERWFSDRAIGHRLLPLARLVFRWAPTPSPATPATAATQPTEIAG